MERRGCCSFVMLLMLISVALGLIGYKHIQIELINKLRSETAFSEASGAKMDLDLTNFGIEFENRKMELQIVEKEIENLQGEVNKMAPEQKKMEEEVKACQGSLVPIKDNIARVEKEKVEFEGNIAASKTKWNETLTDLQKKLQAPSPVCVHVMKDTDANGQCPKQNPTKEAKQS